MGNSSNKFNKEFIETHNNTTAKAKKKILLIGINDGKSHWFNHSTDHKPLNDITYKTAAHNIGDKLPDIESIIYDTPTNEHFLAETLKYIPSANGLILTYCTHNFDALNYLEKHMDTFDDKMNYKTACLLLGMTETRKNNTENNFYYAELIIERANQLASKYRLMHMQIDISINISTATPYICLLRKIMKQKQDAMSPVVDYNFTFDEEKKHLFDIASDPLSLDQPQNHHNCQVQPPPAWSLQAINQHKIENNNNNNNVNEMAVYQSVVYGNNKLLLLQQNQNQNQSKSVPNLIQSEADFTPDDFTPVIPMKRQPIAKHVHANDMKLEKQFSIDSLNAYETNERPHMKVIEKKKNKKNKKNKRQKSMYDAIESMDDDKVCQIEFERFFLESLGKKRSQKYMKMFAEKQYNDIRLVDPDIFDADFFKSDDIKMDILDQKLFQKEIKKYNHDKIKFENILDNLDMKEKYRRTFENRGIATLWSFHYYIQSVRNINSIIKNKNDTEIIWNELCSNSDKINAANESEGNLHNNNGNNEKRNSDSEEMYMENNNMDTGHAITGNKSSLSPMAAEGSI